jgi:hypothetical protein
VQAQNPDHVAETAPTLSAVCTSFKTAPGRLLFAASNNLPQAAIKVSQGLSGND